METWKHGNTEAWKHGGIDMGKWTLGHGMEIYTWKRGSGGMIIEIWTWRHGNGDMGVAAWT
jgi:hypothetical protein